MVHSCLSLWCFGTVFATLQTMKYKKNPSLPVERWKCFLKVCGKSVHEDTGLSADLMMARTWVFVEIIIWIVVVLEGHSWSKIL